MYERYFNLSENPFTIAPNPRYFYLSAQHREALAHLRYGLNENGGFILLTGEVGTGKTTAWRCLVENLPTDVDLAIVLNPRVNEIELLETICDELGIAYEQGSGIKKLTDALNRHLLDTYARRRRTIVIVEEAQNISAEVLEQLRLLTNLETNESKLLQIILIGQPELLEKLSDPQLRQLRQRIIAHFHLEPFNLKDVRAYVHHRLSVAGASSRLFSDAAIRKLTKHSQGIPRLINLICDRALLGCFSEERGHVDARTVSRAAHEVFGTHRFSKRRNSLSDALPNPNQTNKRRSYVRPVAWFATAATIAAVAVAIDLAPSRLPILFNDNNLSGNMVKHILNVAAIGDSETADNDVETDNTATPAQQDMRDTEIAANDVETDDDTATPTQENIGDTEIVAIDVETDNIATLTQEDTSDTEITSNNAGTAYISALTHQNTSDPDATSQEIEPAALLWQNRLAIASRKQDPYRTLFSLWSVELPEVMEQSPCEYALGQQLDCWHRRGNINSIKRVNRPALLKMISTEGQLFYAVLKTIDKSNRLRLVAADQTIDITEDKLEAVWTGEYTLLWKRPENYRDTIYPGDTNQTVGWLSEQLASLPDYGPPIKASLSYGYDMENRIRLLQKRCGIFVDGLVGRETLIKINTLTGKPPKLQQSEGCSGVS